MCTDGDPPPGEQGADSKRKDRPHSHRAIYRHSLLYRHYGAGILLNLQCDRRRTAKTAGAGDRPSVRPNGHGADPTACEPGHPQSGDRRYLYRRGQCAQLSAHHRHPVFLPVFNGRQRLHCPRGLCNGQAAAQDRPVRQEHRAHAHRLWLHRAGGHGHPHLNQRAGSKDDHSAYALYELYRQTAHLLLLRQRLFPGQGRADHVRAVPAGDSGRHWSRLSL